MLAMQFWDLAAPKTLPALAPRQTHCRVGASHWSEGSCCSQSLPAPRTWGSPLQLVSTPAPCGHLLPVLLETSQGVTFSPEVPTCPNMSATP